MSEIFIYSNAIRSGKTTALMEWTSGLQNVAGVLSPDVDGLRKLYDIEQRKYFDLQLSPQKSGIKIGRFVFDENVFEQAQKILLGAIDKSFDWVIIDEIGRLEMDKHNGLEPALEKVITYFKQQHSPTKLLLVIRDYLLDKAIDYYGLQQAKILSQQALQYPSNNINGIVLCGGKSERMQQDKAFLSYHGKPQYQQVYEMLHQFCDKVVVSTNAHQAAQIDMPYKTIIDEKCYANAGPMTGVLSCAKNDNNNAVMLCGCDYPYLKRAHILTLLQAREKDFEAICFSNKEGFIEPLVSILEASALRKLYSFYNSGNTSLRHFLSSLNTKVVSPDDDTFLKSLDTREDFNDFDLKKYYNE